MIFAILKGIGKTFLAIAVGAGLSLLFYLVMKIAGELAILLILIGIILIFLINAISNEINNFKNKTQYCDNNEKKIINLSQKFEDTIEALESEFLSSGGRKTFIIDCLIKDCEDIIQELVKLDSPNNLHIDYADQLRELLEFYNY